MSWFIGGDGSQRFLSLYLWEKKKEKIREKRNVSLIKWQTEVDFTYSFSIFFMHLKEINEKLKKKYRFYKIINILDSYFLSIPLSLSF